MRSMSESDPNLFLLYVKFHHKGSYNKFNRKDIECIKLFILVSTTHIIAWVCHLELPSSIYILDR